MYRGLCINKETNVYLNSQLNNLEHKHCKKTNELEKKLTEKTKEVSKLTNNAIDLKAQINLLVEPGNQKIRLSIIF